MHTSYFGLFFFLFWKIVSYFVFTHFWLVYVYSVRQFFLTGFVVCVLVVSLIYRLFCEQGYVC